MMENNKKEAEKEADYIKKLKQMSSAEIDAYIKKCVKKDKKELDAFIEESET